MTRELYWAYRAEIDLTKERHALFDLLRKLRHPPLDATDKELRQYSSLVYHLQNKVGVVKLREFEYAYGKPTDAPVSRGDATRGL